MAVESFWSCRFMICVDAPVKDHLISIFLDESEILGLLWLFKRSHEMYREPSMVNIDNLLDDGITEQVFFGLSYFFHILGNQIFTNFLLWLKWFVTELLQIVFFVEVDISIGFVRCNFRMERKVINIFINKSNTVSCRSFVAVTIIDGCCFTLFVHFWEILQTDPNRLTTSFQSKLILFNPINETILNIISTGLFKLIRGPFILVYFEVAIHNFLGSNLFGFFLVDIFSNFFWLTRL